MHIDSVRGESSRRFGRKRRRASPLSVGERLALALFELARGEGSIIIHREMPWASITFSGSRHTVTMSFAGLAAIDAGEQMIAALPDHEFAIPGQLVAEAQLIDVEHRLVPEPRLRITVELLLLDEA